MNTANYKSNGSYPLSTDALDFMQEQIKLTYNLTDLLGKYYILREPTDSADGLVVFNGELMPLKGDDGIHQLMGKNYIGVVESKQTVTANGVIYSELRTVRYAQYDDVAITGDASKVSVSAFERLTTLPELAKQLTEAKQHIAPKGTVIDYYGSPCCDDLPYGWVPCAYFYRVPTASGNPDVPLDEEREKWTNRYSTSTVKFATNLGGGYIYLRVTECNGVKIPDLSERFVVTAGGVYSLGETGGADSVKLTADESGLPAHNHTYYYKDSEAAGSTQNLVQGDASNTGVMRLTGVNEAKDASQAHENRPPFFALYKLIKVI